jgi:hypothetical protein
MKFVRLSALRTGRLYPRKYSWYSFLLKIVWPEGSCQWKIPKREPNPRRPSFKRGASTSLYLVEVVICRPIGGILSREELDGILYASQWRSFQIRYFNAASKNLLLQWTRVLLPAWHTTNLGYDQNFCFDLRPYLELRTAPAPAWQAHIRSHLQFTASARGVCFVGTTMLVALIKVCTV